VVWALLVGRTMNALRRFLVVGWAALSVVAGCGGVSLQPSDGGSKAGHGGGGSTGGSAGSAGGAVGGHSGGAGRDGGAADVVPACSGLDQGQCAATQGCTAQICPSCYGQDRYSTCYRSDEAPPVCVALPCAVLPCNSLNETDCLERSDCQTESCPSCNGTRGFAGCIAPGQPSVQCPAACLGAPCGELDESVCKTRSDCTPGYCPDCMGGQTFADCLAAGDAVACALGCPAQEPCADVTTEAACSSRSDCHSVFTDPGTCDCAVAGCCAKFSRCADGATASCKGPALCNIAGPSCESPAFVISYASGCYEGCVRPAECGP
jgi:hypothetical protein